ncbi:ATP-binding protein [bacterium]|nr:ATP-binding protein [bacterium]
MNGNDLRIRIQDALKRLKMPGLGREVDSLFREARTQKWSLDELLLQMLNAEIRSREDSVTKLRLKQARFPELKTLDGFDFTILHGIDAQSIHRLACCEWLANRHSLIFAGPIGTGKTHLAIALGIEACRRKYRVKFTRAADLVRDLTESRDERSLGKMQRHLLTQDLLILDELGFVPFDRVGG